MSKRRSYGNDDCKFLTCNIVFILIFFLSDEDRFQKRARYTYVEESIEDKLDDLIARIGDKVSCKSFVL